MGGKERERERASGEIERENQKKVIEHRIKKVYYVFQET